MAARASLTPSTSAEETPKIRVEDPFLRSGLALAGANQTVDSDNDGWITAREIDTLDLAGTELVVLSACNTGLGDLELGEGSQGMCRAFLRDGVKGIVMSLYPVPDAQTVILMDHFYANLKNGLSARNALRGAQLDLLHKAPSAFPSSWASFVYIGKI